LELHLGYVLPSSLETLALEVKTNAIHAQTVIESRAANQQQQLQHRARLAAAASTSTRDTMHVSQSAHLTRRIQFNSANTITKTSEAGIAQNSTT
jgi:hypothetical protein